MSVSVRLFCPVSQEYCGTTWFSLDFPIEAWMLSLGMHLLCSTALWVCMSVHWITAFPDICVQKHNQASDALANIVLLIARVFPRFLVFLKK